MRDCATRSFLHAEGASLRTCSAAHLTVKETSCCIVNSRKTTMTLGLDHLYLVDKQRWKITTQFLKSSRSRLHFPPDKVHVLSTGRGWRRPSLGGTMSRAVPEGERLLRSPLIKPPDCHYCQFYPTFSPPPPPLLSSSSCAGVKTSFLGLHDK